MPKVPPERLEARRRQIVDAAMRLFADRGPSATSMHDIIAASGLSAGAVYHYFPAKRGLIAAVGEAVADAYREPLRGALGDGSRTPREVVGLLTAALDELHARDVDITRLGVLMWAEALRDPDHHAAVVAVQRSLRDDLERVAVRWRELGAIPALADPAEVAQALYAVFPGYTLQLNLLGGTSAPAFLAGFDALADGVSGPRTDR